MAGIYLKLANNAKTILQEVIDNVTTSIPVLDTTSLPTTFPYLLTIWDGNSYPTPSDDPNTELVLVTGMAGNILTVERGYGSTSAEAHNVSDSIALLVTTEVLDDAIYGIEAVLDEHLDNVANPHGVTATQITGAAIKTEYEAEADTNAYTDAEKLKLANVEAGATGDQTAPEIVNLINLSGEIIDEDNVSALLTRDSELQAHNVNQDAHHPKNHNLETHDTTVTGAQLNSMKTKVDGIENGATGDQTGSEIKVLYESQANTNAYTDAEKAKAAGHEDNATQDQTGAEIKQLYEEQLNTNAFTDADESKLDGIEDNATRDQTKSDIDALGVDAATLGGKSRSEISPLTTKGDLLTFGTDNARLPVGTLGQVVVGYPGSPNGLVWISPHVSTGFIEEPTITENPDGTVDIPAKKVSLADNPDHEGTFLEYILPAVTNQVLLDNTVSYIVGDHNAGDPKYSVITDVSLINSSNVVPYITVYRDGTNVHALEWGQHGDGLSNKTVNFIVKTQRFTYQDGLALGEAPTRLVTIETGNTWNAIHQIEHLPFNSSVNPLEKFYHSAGAWVHDDVTQYENAYWDNGTDLVALLPNKWVNNWVYRMSEEAPSAVIVVGTASHGSLLDASLEEHPVSVPDKVASFGILVGRIIVQQGATSSGKIETAFNGKFNPVPVSDHTDLTNVGVYTHGELDSHVDATDNPHAVTKTQTGLGNVTNEAQVPLTQKGAANGVPELDSQGKIPLAQLPDVSKMQTYVVETILERDALTNLIEGEKCFITNDGEHTGDSYIWDSLAWQLLADADWENVNLEWANINGKPTSVVADIDDAVAKKHSHTNKALLDTYTQTEADIADAIAKEHVHGNFGELALITDGLHESRATNPHGVTATQVGLGNVTNDAQVPLSQKGQPSGVAEISSAGNLLNPGNTFGAYRGVSSVIEFYELTDVEAIFKLNRFGINDWKAYVKNGGVYKLVVLDDDARLTDARTPLAHTLASHDTTVTGTQLNDLKTKVDGIEDGATADQTKADIDALLIDAASLVGVAGANFARTDVDTTFDSGVSTTVTVLSDDAGESILNLIGDVQGTGRIFLGQSLTYGGGLHYQGNAAPAFGDLSAYKLSFYRVENGVVSWTAMNSYASNDWIFRGAVNAIGGLKADTIDEYNTGNGVTADGVLLKDGLVDGRDVATDGTKLDGVEDGATADLSAAEILALLLTVDGAGSLLDADKLDNIDSGGYAKLGSGGNWDSTYFDRVFSSVEEASPQYWLLCENTGNNDVDGRIIVNRTSGNWQSAILDIVISSSTTEMKGGALSTLQVMQSTEDYSLVTVTYGVDSKSYVAIKYVGNNYPSTYLSFTGRLKSTALSLVATTNVTGEVVMGGDTKANFVVDDLKVNSNNVWHAGNDGVGSGLDAGLLAGKALETTSNYWDVIPWVHGDGVMEVGKFIDFHETDADTDDKDARIQCVGGVLDIIATDLTLNGGAIGGGAAYTPEKFIGGEISVGVIPLGIMPSEMDISAARLILEGSLPEGSNLQVDIRKGGVAVTDSIFTGDAPMEITTTHTLTGNVYIAESTTASGSPTIDSGRVTFSKNVMVYAVVVQIGSTFSGSDLRVQLVF